MPEENGQVKEASESASSAVAAAAADTKLIVADEQQPAAAAVVTASPAEDAAAAGATAVQGSTATASPVLVFLNSASGGKMGPKVLEKISDLIPESQ